MTLPNITTIPDADGLHGLQLFDRGALRSVSQKPRDEEEPDMSKPTLDNPWANPEYWGIGAQPQQQQQQPAQQQQSPQPQLQQQGVPQQQQPQIVLGKDDPNNPAALPKDQETLNRMVQQNVYGVLGSLAATSQAKQQKINHLRSQFMASEQHRPWYPVAEAYFNKQVNSGFSIEQAAQDAINHISELHRMGMKPPERQQNALIPSQFSGGVSLGNNQLRTDESSEGLSHYSDEQRLADRERYIKHRRQHQEWIKTGGARGKALHDLYPKAFE